MERGVHVVPLLELATVAAAAAAALILVWFLAARPPLVWATKLWLLFGAGVLPIGAALLGNVAGFETTKERRFCASCHLMQPFTEDAADRESTSLASMHSRNARFGGESCYVCHADYGLFGALPGFADDPEHAAVAEELAKGAIGCATSGCHGPAHPAAAQSAQ